MSSERTFLLKWMNMEMFLIAASWCEGFEKNWLSSGRMEQSSDGRHASTENCRANSCCCRTRAVFEQNCQSFGWPNSWKGDEKWFCLGWWMAWNYSMSWNQRRGNFLGFDALAILEAFLCLGTTRHSEQIHCSCLQASSAFSFDSKSLLETHLLPGLISANKLITFLSFCSYL